MDLPGRSSRLWAWGLVALLGALSAGAWLSVDWRESRVPGDDAIRAASALVRAEFQDGDGVVVVPFWEERPWHGLENMGTGTDGFPYPALVRAERSDPARLLGFRRIWVIAAFGQEAAPPGLLAADRTLVRETSVGEGVSVGLWETAGLASVARLSVDFPKLQVARRGETGDVKTCSAGPERHVCGLQPWYDLHFQTRDVFHQQVTWIYAHPGPGTRTLVIGWPELPRGEAVLLRVGQTLAAVRHAEGEPAEILVRVDGEEALRVVLPPHVYALERLLLPVRPGPGEARVDIELYSPDPRRREILIEADMLSAVRPSVAAWATRDLRATN
jgi:hypothetical protein